MRKLTNKVRYSGVRYLDLTLYLQLCYVMSDYTIFLQKVEMVMFFASRF